MKILLYILLAFAAPFILVCLYAIGYAFYLIVTGKDKSPEIQAKITDKKERDAKKKEERKSKTSHHWLSYPSPLNKWGLWN